MKFSRILMLLCVLLALACVCLTACGDDKEPVDSVSDTTETNQPTTEAPADTTPAPCTHGHTEIRNAIAATCEEKGYTGDTYCLDCSQVIANGQEIAALGHSWNNGEFKAGDEPTCTAPGTKTFTCTRDNCGATKTESAAARGHDWDDGVIKEGDEPTCTAPGTKTYTCKRDHCGATKTEAVAATGHNHIPTVTAPTCTAQGYTTHTCACGDTYIDTYTDSLGHDWDDGVIKEGDEPTCTEAGTKTYTCKRDHCGATYTEPVSALGHNYETNVTEPTCTKQGYTTHTCLRCDDSYVDTYTDSLGHDWDDGVIKDGDEPTCTKAGVKTYTCKRDHCGATYTEPVSALGHNYETNVTGPTCTAQGYTTHTCLRCGDTYVDTYTDALGHSWDAGVIKEGDEPTHTEPGKKTYTCGRCGATRTEVVPATGHTSFNEDVTKPTCTEQGYTTYTCTDPDCGYSYQANYTNALGHSWDEGKYAKPEDAPTCTKAGVKTYTCTRDDCGATYTETVAALGHNYEANVTGATCTEHGYTTHTCSRCGDSYVDTYTNALGHSWDAGVIKDGDEPTCTEAGVKTYTCTRDGCGATYTEAVAALGHNYEANVTGATCTEQGYTTHTCSRCGDSYVDTYTDALGHAWDDGEITTPATCTTKGVKTYTCSRCGETRTEELPLTAHTPSDATVENLQKATCTQSGSYDLVIRCKDCGALISSEHKELPAEGHQAAEARTGVKEATCGDAGYTGDILCTKCGAKVVEGEEIPASGNHTWNGDEIITKNPTCSEKGAKTQTCTVCGATQSVEIPATGNHDYEYTYVNGSSHRSVCKICGKAVEGELEAHTPTGEGEYKQPDCTADGYYVYTCTDCGATYQVIDEGSAHAYHDFGDWTITKDATCISKGKQTRTCKDCGKVETAEIPVSAEAHSWVLDHTDNASCTQTGTHYYRCERNGCDAEKTETIPNLAHEYVTDPTDVNFKVCKLCNDRTRVIGSSVTADSLDTTQSANVELEEATIQLPTTVLEQIQAKAGENTDATVEIKADVLDEEAKATAISNVEDEKQKAALENADIYDFGVLVDGESLTANGNTFNESVVVTLPYTLKDGEVAEGIVVYYVKDDGKIEKVVADYFEQDGQGYVRFTTDHFSYYAVAHEETPAMRCARGDHDYTIEVKVVDATCLASGYTIVECKHCHKTAVVDVTPRIAEHTFGDPTVVEPTCTEQGYTVKVCSVCGYKVKTNYTNALGHTPDHAATCTEPSRCTTCNTILVPASGHEWSEWKVISESTATREGIRQRYCPKCGTIEQVRVAKLATNGILIDADSYQDLLGGGLDALLGGENAELNFDFYSAEDGANSARITAAKINGKYALLIAYTSKDYQTEEQAIKNVYIKNGLMVLFSEKGDAVYITPYGGDMSFEEFKQMVAQNFAQYDAMAQMAFAEANEAIDEYGDTLDMLSSLLESPAISENIKGFVTDTQSFYVYLVRTFGLSTGLYMDANANLPTVSDVLNVIGKFATVTETLDGKTYTISLEEIWAELNKLVEAASKLTPETTIAEVLFDSVKDEIQESYPDLETIDDLKEKILEKINGEMTAKELIDLLIDLSENSEDFELSDLYASINEMIKVYASMMPQSQNSENDQGGMMDLENFDVEAILTYYYDMTLDDLLVEVFEDEDASVAGMVEMVFGMRFADLPAKMIPYVGNYICMMTQNEKATVLDAIGIATGMIQAYKPTLEVVIEVDDFGHILNITADGEFAANAQAMGGGSNGQGGQMQEDVPHGDSGESEKVPYGVYVWHINESEFLYRIFDGNEVYYFYEVYPDPDSEEYVDFIATYTEVGYEAFEWIQTEEEWSMTIEECIHDFFETAEGKRIDLDEQLKSDEEQGKPVESENGEDEGKIPEEKPVIEEENEPKDGSDGEIPTRGVGEIAEDEPKGDDEPMGEEPAGEEPMGEEPVGEEPTGEEPEFFTIYSFHFSLAINSKIVIEEPDIDIPDAVPTVTENEDGSTTVSGLPEGYEWDISISSSQSTEITDENGETVYGEYVSIEDELIYDATLSEQMGVPVYRIPDAYTEKKTDTDSYVKIKGNYYSFSESSRSVAAFMIPLEEFLENPMANMVQIGYYGSFDSRPEDRIPVYLCPFGYVFEENGEWKRFDWKGADFGYDNDDLIINHIWQTYPVPAAGTQLVFDGEYQMRYEDAFTYNGATYLSYGVLTLSANEGKDVYEIVGCVIGGEFYVLGDMQSETIYVIGEEVKDIDPVFDETLENVAYSLNGEVLCGTLDVYVIETEIVVSTYVAKINGRYYYGYIEEKGGSSVSFSGLYDVSVYGLETIELPDGNTMYVLGQAEGKNHNRGESETVDVTYGYVKFGNLYAPAYTYWNVVKYPYERSAPTAFRSYKEILGDDNLYGLQADGTYWFSAKLMNYLKENRAGSNYLSVTLYGIYSNKTQNALTYEFSVPVLYWHSSSNDSKNWVEFDYWGLFNSNGVRLVAEPDTDSVVAVVSGDGKDEATVQMAYGNASVGWEDADHEDALSESSGFDVYSSTVRSSNSGNYYLLIDGKYYRYHMTYDDQYSPLATFEDLHELIVIERLTFYAEGVYEQKDGEEDAFIEGTVYRISFKYFWGRDFFGQMREGKLWILIDAYEDDETLKFTEAVTYADFIDSIEIKKGTPVVVDEKLPNGRAISCVSAELFLDKSVIGSIDNVYFHVLSDKNVYFTDYDTNSKGTVVQGEEVTLPAGSEVYTYSSNYENGTYTIASVTWYTTSKNYAVKIDGKFYAADLHNGRIQLNGRVIPENELYLSSDTETVKSAIMIDGVWYSVELDWGDFSLLALGEPVEGDVTYSESYEMFILIDGTEYEVYHLDCETSNYTQTEWNGRTAYIAKDENGGYVEITNGYFVEAWFDEDETAHLYLNELQTYLIDRHNVDLSAYVEVIESGVIRLDREILSVLSKYNANQLNINGYSVSISDLKTAFGVYNENEPEKPMEGNENGYEVVPEKPIFKD